MNGAIKIYRQKTGLDCPETDCENCINAIWRLMPPDASVEKTYSTEGIGGRYCLVGKCTALGSDITDPVYFCSARTTSAEQQKADFAGL